MTQEEKAKAYDEALKYAMIYYKNGNEDMKMMMKTCFPFLIEESEDEKIRKEIIEYIRDQQSSFISAPDCRDKYEEEENNKYNSWIAWLEKQGKEDSFIQQAYEQGYTEGKRIERKHWIEKQNFSEDYNSIDPQFGKPIEQNPAEWSEGDENVKDIILSQLRSDNFSGVLGKSLLKETESWLESLKYRVHLRQEWSEEDEKRINRISDFIWKNRKGDTDEIYQQEQDVNWLKSIRPQKQWKPTKEQMDALLFVVQHYTPKVTDKIAWDSLKTLELMYYEIKQ